VNLKEALKGKLTEEERRLVHRSYEIIGDIAIVDIPPELEKKKKVIAEILVLLNKNVKVVLRKVEEVGGEYRIAKYERLLGDHTETVHKESGCSFKVDPTKVYFTSKLSGDRERIAAQVKDGEKILVMFAGVGPYPIVIAKKKDVAVWAVELNPSACKYMEENIIRNNVFGKVYAICGDVRKESPPGPFDRILMPAPRSAMDFLDVALERIKKGGTIHFYSFASQAEIDALPEKVRLECKKLGRQIQIKEVRKIGAFAPRVWRVVVDFVVK